MLPGRDSTMSTISRSTPSAAACACGSVPIPGTAGIEGPGIPDLLPRRELPSRKRASRRSLLGEGGVARRVSHQDRPSSAMQHSPCEASDAHTARPDPVPVTVKARRRRSRSGRSSVAAEDSRDRSPSRSIGGVRLHRTRRISKPRFVWAASVSSQQRLRTRIFHERETAPRHPVPGRPRQADCSSNEPHRGRHLEPADGRRGAHGDRARAGAGACARPATTPTSSSRRRTGSAARPRPTSRPG